MHAGKVFNVLVEVGLQHHQRLLQRLLVDTGRMQEILWRETKAGDRGLVCVYV